MLPPIRPIRSLSLFESNHIWTKDRPGNFLSDMGCRPSPRLVKLQLPDCAMVTRRSTFFKVYSSESRDIESNVPIVPWDVWGPQNSRVLDMGPSSLDPVLTGHRIVCRDEMFDFCPQRFESHGDNADKVDNTEEPFKSTPGIFASEVATCLPCRQIPLSDDRWQARSQSRSHLIETSEGPKVRQSTISVKTRNVDLSYLR